jgi:hypothetical protein
MFNFYTLKFKALSFIGTSHYTRNYEVTWINISHANISQEILIYIQVSYIIYILSLYVVKIKELFLIIKLINN